MKTHIIRHFLFLLLLPCFLMSCANVVETTLKENPEFVQNAETLIITSPLSHRSTAFSKYIIEKPAESIVYEIEAPQNFSNCATTILEEDESDEVYFVKTREITTHTFFVKNPFDEIKYEVIGETTYYRSREEKEDETYESGNMTHPIELLIFEESKDVGKIIINEDRSHIEIVLHGNFVNLEYKAALNKECFTFKNNEGLIAIVGLQPAGFTAIKNTGDIFLKKNLSMDLRADVIAMYLIIESAIDAISEVGL